VTESDRTRQLPPDPAARGEPESPTVAQDDWRPEAPPGADASRPGDGEWAPGAGTLVLDRYRLDRLIGRGGHGAVWEALDERLERQVAVKVIPRGEGGLGERAEREGRVAAQLNHPGIVALYELGSAGDSVCLVSELVVGRTMSELAAAGALSDRDICGIGMALCSALEHAHERGVIHRDVKPQNVLVVAEPAAGSGFAKLTDFGVAHVRGEETLTRTGDVVGTLAYMAPEQAEGGRVATAADVYSLALVLYEGWTGSGPDSAVAARLAGRPITPLRRLRRDLPHRLCRVIDQALDSRAERRPSLAELATELRATADALSEAGGLVEPSTRRRFGIPSAAAVRAPTVGAPPRWLLRAGAGVAAGALVLAALETLAPPPDFVPAPVAAALAAVLVGLLPRIGWMLAAGAVLVWLASPESDQRGTALVLAGALAPTPLLLPRAGLLWSVPAAAPLLGTIGLAPLFVAAAGVTSTAWRRAGLAIAGFGWLIAAEIVSGERLLFGLPGDVEPPDIWEDTLLGAAQEAIYPAVASLVMVPGAVWAVLALAAGVLVRGRNPALDVVGALLWGVAAVAAHEWLVDLMDGVVRAPAAQGVVAGAVLGALLIFVVAALRRRRSDGHYVP
jgi:eukaryotic-like serine/threonine-protein kinase